MKYISISGDHPILDGNENLCLIYDLPSTTLALLLNPSTKEIAKIESNLIQQIELRRWDSLAKLQTYGDETGMFFKQLQRRPKLILLKEQEGSLKTDSLQAQLDTLHSSFRKEAQSVFNENTKLVIELHTASRFKQLEQSFTLILRSFATYIVALNEQERFTKDILSGTIIETNQTTIQQLDDIVGLSWMLLLTGKACTAVTSWAEVDNAETMMKILTRKMSAPKREPLYTPGTITIGCMIIKTPSVINWNTAKRICTALTPLLLEISYGSKTHFYNTIIKKKARWVTTTARLQRETLDRTEAVTEFMRNAPNHRIKNMFAKWRKQKPQLQ